MSSLADLAREQLLASDESALQFLRQSWLSHLPRVLRLAREHAGLTQAELAQLLNTTAGAIAAIEDDDSGKVPLWYIFDLFSACGVVPFDIVGISFEAMRELALLHPDALHTERAFMRLERRHTGQAS